MSNTFEQACRQFDALNGADPRTVETAEGRVPRELLYAQRMTATLAEFAPDASEVLRLAARCQHLCRWQIPRDEFDKDRSGYRAWRKACSAHHGRLAREVLICVGYDAGLADYLVSLLEKKRLKQDPESQTLQDVVSLVFLRYEFDAFATLHSDEKLAEILKRTWLKMSSRGQQVALALDLSQRARRVIALALSGATPVP